MNLKTAISLYAGQSGGSSLINTPNTISDTPKVRDMARRRLVKTNPDVDAAKEPRNQQTDSAAFVGKKYRIQDTKYGHLTSEHDDSDSANIAMLARPYSRILKHNEPRHDPKARKIAQKRAAKHNPDID